MSLFHVQEWYKTIVAGARTMAIAKLIENRDQLIVGSLEGSLTIIDPGINIENRHEIAVIVESQTNKPVLQISTGKFLLSYEQELIVVLHPRSLAYFCLSSRDNQLIKILDNNEAYTLEKLFEHKLHGEAAYSFCQGDFGKNGMLQICVISLNCSLFIFEDQHLILSRKLINSLHPGPIQYSPFTESILTTNDGYLTSFRFSTLTTSLSNNQAKKLNSDWILNLGDTVLDIKIIGVLPIQPSILVLCKRALFCVTHGGAVRFVIRIPTLAICFMVYNTLADAAIQTCIGTAEKTLIFYQDTKMVWNAQLTFVPIFIRLSSFSDIHRNLLAILSSEFHAFIGYLGTAPSLFRMPQTETRFIDFEKRKNEIREFEKVIWKFSRENQDNLNDLDALKVNLEINMDEKSLAYDVPENIPSATIIVSLSGLKDSVDLLFQGQIFAHRTNFTSSSRETGVVPIIVFCKNEPVFDVRCQIMAITNTAEVLTQEIDLPLKLVCHEIPSQRSATFKISLDSDLETLTIPQLFPEFQNENQNSLGVQPYFCETITSIFINNKTKRYRIQSDSTEFLFVLVRELIIRIKKHQPNVKIYSPVPIHLFITGITRYLELENNHGLTESDVNRVSIQMRQTETLLLNKLKSDRENFDSHITQLINYTYRELMIALDKLSDLRVKLKAEKCFGFRALLNLLKEILSISDVALPFDGRILDATDQKFGERFCQIMGESIGQIANNEEASSITRILVEFCEHSGTSETAIAELNEDEAPEEETNEIKQNKELKKLDKDYEFLRLESGSLAAANFTNKS